MLIRKEAPPEMRGTCCPMRDGERCMGQACAWWRGTGEREGACAVLEAAAALVLIMQAQTGRQPF